MKLIWVNIVSLGVCGYGYKVGNNYKVKTIHGVGEFKESDLKLFPDKKIKLTKVDF